MDKFAKTRNQGAFDAKRLRNLSIVTFACVAVLASALFAFMHWTRQVHDTETWLIEQAGRQSTQSQRVSVLSQQLLRRIRQGALEQATAIRDDLSATLEVWRSEYESMLAASESASGSSQSMLATAEALRSLRAARDEAQGSAERLLAFENIASRNAAEDELVISAILEATDAYRLGMLEISDFYGHEAQAAHDSLYRFGLTVTALIFGLLAALTVFVLKPILRRLRTNELDLINLRSAIDKHTLYSMTDRRGRIVDVNEGFCKLSGYTFAELVGRSHNVVNSGTHPKSFWQDMWRTIASGRTWRAEVCNKARDGTLYWVDSTNIPHFDNKGQIDGFISLRFDISKKKQAEALMQEAHQALTNLLDASTHISIIATDTTGVITTFNAGAERMLGYRAEEVVGKHSPAIVHLESEIIERGQQLSDESGEEIAGFDVFVWYVRHGGHEEREWTYVRRDGSQFPVRLMVTGVQDARGSLVGFLGIAKDVSEQKLVEQKLAQQRQEHQDIIDAIPGLVWYKDASSIVLDCNESAASVIGLDRESIRGKSTEELFGASSAEHYREVELRALRTGKPVLGLIEQVDRPGQSAVHMRMDTIPLRGPSGNFDRVVAIATDVTSVVAAADQIREAEQRLDLAMRASSTGMWDWNVATGATYFNDVVFSMLGYELGELEATIDTWKDLCHPDDLSGSSLALAEHIDGKTETYSAEYRIRCKDGFYMWIRDVGQIVERDNHGLPKRIVGVYINIQELQSALASVESFNDELRLVQQRFELAIEGSQDALFDWDIEAGEVYFSPRWSSMLGLPIEESGDSLFDIVNFIDPTSAGKVELELTKFLNSERNRLDIEFEMVASNKSRIWVMMRAAAVRDEDGNALRVSGSLADITSLKAVQSEMERLVQQDHLTGLASRSCLIQRLEHAISRSKRNHSYCGLLFFDFDRFKVVNDSLGHDVGDKLLCSIASRLEHAVREVDTVARFGGDEFVILLEEMAAPEDAAAVAEKLLEICEDPHVIDGHSLVSTASIGYVTSAQKFEHAADLLRYADAAMYEAKRTGRCRVVEFDTVMYREQVRKAALEEDLKTAIHNGELRLFFQPIVDLESGKVISAEALLRWQHPEKGNISPADFIPIAEESRQIVPIGEWVIRQACRLLTDWRLRGIVSEEFAVSINASKVQLLNASFAEFLVREVDRVGLPRRCIKIEVTETTVVDNRSDVGDALRALREQSFIIMMDDFGTGHSSLSVLHKLPIDELKIDQSFIRNADHNRDLVAITSSIVALADHLNLKTIGEGVESVQQIALLQTLGCHYGQGYYWSKPLAADEFETFVISDSSAATSPRFKPQAAPSF